jgi:hypothetical protein
MPRSIGPNRADGIKSSRRDPLPQRPAAHEVSTYRSAQTCESPRLCYSPRRSLHPNSAGVGTLQPYKITVPGRVGVSVQDTAVFIQGKHQVLPALERAVTVAELSETAAVLDYNHPLAGKTLVVQIKILKVENPS